jgi:hypothetical protein
VTINEDKLNALLGQFVGDLGAAVAAGSVVVGNRRTRMRSALDEMIRERAGEDGVAETTAPLNIGWGRKDDGR